MFKTQRFELVEIQVGTNVDRKQFNFPDLPNLTGRDGQPVIIDSIVAYYNDVINKSPLSGNEVVDGYIIRNTALTIYQGDLQVLNKMPLPALAYVGVIANSFNSGVIQQPLLKDLINVSWTKSFLTYADTGSLTANTVFLIGVHYTVLSSEMQIVPANNNFGRRL
jgi:hypothetical protein